MEISETFGVNISFIWFLLWTLAEKTKTTAIYWTHSLMNDKNNATRILYVLKMYFHIRNGMEKKKKNTRLNGVLPQQQLFRIGWSEKKNK